MDNRLRHVHRNGKVICGMREASNVLLAMMERDGLNLNEISAKARISTAVMQRLVAEFAATRPTIQTIERALHVTLPLPAVSTRYTGKITGPHDGGYQYVIHCGKTEMRGWRCGKRTEVAAHLEQMVKRLNEDWQ